LKEAGEPVVGRENLWFRKLMHLFSDYSVDMETMKIILVIKH
jgi:hypothetical protein